ncbi:MAG: NAD(P)-dependent oxidoreductase [Mesorhizobium sp.]|nr:MAG: NAD(P)-dependent oxidoreductase [Mesorhizobium sp.]
MTTARVGFIGLGSMGAALAERFVVAGMPLTVCDVNVDNIAPFEKAGAEVVSSPRLVADRAEVVFACLPTTQISLGVALGPDGVAHGSAIKVYVETSTIGMKIAQEIEAGLPATIGFVDAPVSGGPPGARSGTLSVMASAAAEHFERASPYLSAMAKNVFHVGLRPGQAQVAKLINNHLSAAGRLAAFEGLVLALKAGINPKALIDMINVSSGRNYTTTDKVPEAILSGTFKFNGRLAISIKDQTLLREEADALGVPLWVAPRLLETLKEAAAAGYLDQDSMLVIQYMGEQAGIDVRAMMRADG